MDDLEFVRRCTKGDKQSWDQFVEQYSRLIYSSIYSILKIKGLRFTQDHIQDLFQEIFSSLLQDSYKKLKSFQAKGGCSLASWLRQVTVNFTISYIRGLKPMVSLEEENEDGLLLKDILPGQAGIPADTLIQKEKLAQLKECIDLLNRDDRFFLELHINRGITLERLTGKFRLSRGAIDMQKSRIMERLKECFRGKGFALDF
jgi:RNA polymerase sigma factor (sigma-70 family)